MAKATRAPAGKDQPIVDPIDGRQQKYSKMAGPRMPDRSTQARGGDLKNENCHDYWRVGYQVTEASILLLVSS